MSQTTPFRILIAEDDAASGMTLSSVVEAGGWHPILITGGADALRRLTSLEPPTVALVDWNLPDMSGVELCRQVRRLERPPFIIMVTGKTSSDEVAQGLDAGADDYVMKPVRKSELCARIRAGIRTLELRDSLRDRVRDLEAALARVNELERLLSICSYCRRIRQGDEWQTVEKYLRGRSAVSFSHGCCPECHEKMMKEIG